MDEVQQLQSLTMDGAPATDRSSRPPTPDPQPTTGQLAPSSAAAASSTMSTAAPAPTGAAGSRGQMRKDYLSWPDYFMNLAMLSALRSKDPSTQVGACIVDRQNKIVGIGYNGMPTNCPDEQLPWGKDSDDPLENKYLYVCHAELNAILNKNAADLKDCTLYVTLFPCNECAKVIIQSRIERLFYMQEKNPEKPANIASKRLLRMAGVRFDQYLPKPVVLKLD